MENSATNDEGPFNGQWLRGERLKRGLHQHQLASLVDAPRNINQGRISEWESGVKPIPPHRVTQLREIFRKRN